MAVKEQAKGTWEVFQMPKRGETVRVIPVGRDASDPACWAAIWLGYVNGSHVIRSIMFEDGQQQRVQSIARLKEA